MSDLSDLNTGAEFYIYDGLSRIGIVDSEGGPGACDIVSEEFEADRHGVRQWRRYGTVNAVPYENLRALVTAVDLLQSWEGGKTLPQQVVVKIEVPGD